MVKVISQEADCEQPEEAESLIPWPDPAMSSKMNVTGIWRSLPKRVSRRCAAAPRVTALYFGDLSNAAAPQVVQKFSGVLKWLQDDRNFIDVLNDEGLWVVSKPADRQPAENRVLEQLRSGLVMANPFDLKTVLLAKHAQHVVLIHFPIALFITAVVFDIIAQWTKRRSLAHAAYYNLLVAAISTVPVLATGLLAWQFQLEGQKLKGVLLLHLVLAGVSTVMIWLVWWVHFRARRRSVHLPSYRLALELLAVGIVALTGHLGGFLSGVNLLG